MTAATACLPVDVLPRYFGRSPARRPQIVELEFFERVAHAESLNDVTIAAGLALQNLAPGRTA